MKSLLITAVLSFYFIRAEAQYKNDNVAFTTVYPEELCSTLEKNKGYMLLDVRSPGEHHDTSTFSGYNLGRIKGAKNINISDLGKRIHELDAYKDKPIFVYCSHSQRSRRAGKMLADSGFTKVFNINGGMTALHYTGMKQQGCLKQLVESSNPYSIVSLEELCEKVNSGRVYVLDVRSDSAWNHISRDAKENGLGHIRGAEHISLADLPSKMGAVPKKEIIITDVYGDQASKAAALLRNSDKGYNVVSVLIEGVDRLAMMDVNEVPCKREIYVPGAEYQVMGPIEFGRFVPKQETIVFLDLRSKEEFAGTHMDTWRNIGHLKGAINIPAAEIPSRIEELLPYMNTELVLYAFSGSPEVFEAASILQQNGWKKVTVLMGGLFNLRWTAANRKGQAALKDWVVDIPEVNW